MNTVSEINKSLNSSLVQDDDVINSGSIPSKKSAAGTSDKYW